MNSSGWSPAYFSPAVGCSARFGRCWRSLPARSHNPNYIEPQAEQQLQRFNEAVRTSPTARQIQGDLAQSPMQQFEQMLANVANIGNTLATGTLTSLNTAFHTTSDILVGINDFLKQHPTATAVAGDVGLGGASLLALGGAGYVGSAIGRGLGWWGGLFGLGGGGESAGLSMGAEAAAGGGGLLAALPGLGTLAGLSIGAHSALTSDYLEDTIFGKGHAASVRAAIAGHAGAQAATPAPAVAPAPPHTVSPAAAAAAAAGREPAPPATPAQINVHVGPITMSGVADASTFNSLLTKLTDAIRSALAHTSGDGMGSDSSIYVVGGP